jgi:transcriptional regulator with XRE-family HTH domain
MTNNQPLLGQRLYQWRLANTLNIADVAARLSLTYDEVFVIERGYLLDIDPSTQERIESLIRPDHNAIVDAATAAIKAGLESGATVVRIVRCATPTTGRVVVVIGGDDIAWEREE